MGDTPRVRSEPDQRFNTRNRGPTTGFEHLYLELGHHGRLVKAHIGVLAGEVAVHVGIVLSITKVLDGPVGECPGPFRGVELGSEWGKDAERFANNGFVEFRICAAEDDPLATRIL